MSRPPAQLPSGAKVPTLPGGRRGLLSEMPGVSHQLLRCCGGRAEKQPGPLARPASFHAAYSRCFISSGNGMTTAPSSASSRCRVRRKV